MACEVEYSATALRQLRKFDRPVARRILDHLDEVAALEDDDLESAHLRRQA